MSSRLVDAIFKYKEISTTYDFTTYEKEFAQKLVTSLSQGYFEGKIEPPLVEIIKDIVNGLDNHVKKIQKERFELSTKTIYAHGYRSKVNFDYYGQMKQCELCDLIFIISIVLDGKKYFEKITLNQFKKNKNKTKGISWDISNKKQLYLLSRFPKFIGIEGSIIPKKQYALPDFSNCLGSYGLLFKPGDFAFISGSLLDSVIGNKKTFNKNDFKYFINNQSKNQFVLFPFYRFYPYEILEVLGNRYFCNNVFDFVKNFIRSNIGEPTFMEKSIENSQALLFINDLITELDQEAKREQDKKVSNFVNSFRKFPYSAGNFLNLSNKGEHAKKDNGGLGIIHTTINLGE